ncbi:unnamed protein product [Amaranthus hypochondriacus]
MEKKQLNFSAPLMSARRYSSPLRSSGEDNKRDSPPNHPNSIHTQRSDVNLGEVVKPGSVPFIWEQIPGKAKGGNESNVLSPQEVPTTPRVPPTMPFPPGKKSVDLNGFRTPNMLSGELVILRPRNKLSSDLNTLRPNKLSSELKTLSAKFPSSISGVARWESSKEETEINEESSESENDDATFSDAIETFSQHESFSINCSVSGLSASERPETKHPDNPPTDPKARDFMMNRFLPAAKAMTLEPSQYATRKQLVAVEQNKEVKALVPRAMTPPPNGNVYNIVPYTGQDIGSEDESDDEEDSYDGRSALSVKVKACRFLPWFCSKNSLRLVNPLPSMKDRSKIALSSASKLSKLVKTKSWRSPSHKMVKDPYSKPKQKPSHVHKSCELQKPPTYTRPTFYSGELQTRSSSPYRTSRRSIVSPFRNESPHNIYQNNVGFLAVPRRVDSFEDSRSENPQKGSKRFEDLGRKKRNSRTTTPAEKKHVESVNIAKVSHSILNLPKNKRQTVDKSIEEAVKLEYGGRLALMKARGMTESEKQNTNSCRELVLVSADDTSIVQSSLTPPLPKSPSESWLSRQLPSASPRVSPRNSVSYSSLNSMLLSRNQNVKPPTSGAKWETIVKSSHLRKDYGRYSEELVTRVSQQPRIWK